MKNILIYNSGGGLGDSIQLFPLILSLKNHFKDSHFCYLGAHENHYTDKLKNYNININTLELGLKYFGFRWWHFLVAKKRVKVSGIKEFDLIIDLQSKVRNTLILKRIPHKNFYSSCLRFRFCSKKDNFIVNSNLVEMTVKNLSIFLNEQIKLIKYDVKNIPKLFIDEAKSLLPEKDYIGFSLTQGNIYRKKSWSLDKFISLAKEIIKIGKIPVFFVEKKNLSLINRIKEEIPGALFPEENSKIEDPVLVTALGLRLEKAISIDNGVMHMLGLTNIPMVILFGPTNSKKFSPKNQNIDILDTKLLFNSSDINKISVSEVLKLLTK
tara:strand:- start:679 stop:1653 length:975 start_codon:yes stop_codon:yes gene_type:complete